MGTELNSRVRLFCFPHAGGGFSFFHAWSKFLAPLVDFVPVELPGHERRLRQAPFDRLIPLAQALVDELGFDLTTPFVLFGHSFGALLAFEFAPQLRRAQLPAPLHLYLSGRPAPQLPDLAPPLHDLPDAELIDGIQQRYGGIPQQVIECPELMEIFLPVLRADFAAVETYPYQPQDPFDLPITCYGGTADRMTPYASLLAWQAHTRGLFDTSMFPGGHFYLQEHRDAFLHKFAGDLSRVLDEHRTNP